MKTIIFYLLLNIVLFPNSKAQKVTKINPGDLIDMISDSTEQIRVIHFWATWCGPCITELPHFIEASKEISFQSVEFIFLSLDFPSQAESKLKPFLMENSFDINVQLMNDLDYNSWVPLVNKNWKGNLPATLFIDGKNNKKTFTAGIIEKEKLFEKINTIIN